MDNHLDESDDACIQASITSLNGEGANSLASLIELGILDENGQEVEALRSFSSIEAFVPSGVFNIIVESGLLSSISASLTQYKNDLEQEGYEVRIVEFEGDAAGLRAELQDRNSEANLEGAILVGDLPVQYFSSIDDFSPSGRLVEYPHDLYFMDMDGEYVFNATGPDVHVDGTGDVAPEIYVSRITASELGNLSTSSEAELINGYFDKLHDARMGIQTYEERAIWFADDDWARYEGDLDSLDDLYSDVTDIRTLSETTVEEYQLAIQQNVESLIQQIHSWPSGLSVSGIGGGVVTAADLVELNAQPAFLNLWNCSASNFTLPSNLASTFLLLSEGVLNTVGSTKTGSMLNFADFYDPQAQDLTLGQAFRAWFEDNAAATNDPFSDWKIDWHYGLTMQGDPTMGPSVLRDILPIILMGTEGDDRLVGTQADDTILGVGGNDKLVGGLGDDLLAGGDGNDRLQGDDGADVLEGGRGNDQLNGGDGDDQLFGNDGNDRMQGGDGEDRLFGNDGNDKLAGGKGDDRLFGNDGNDRLQGDDGDDILSGGLGDDKLRGGNGDDDLSGGSGNDLLDGQNGDDFMTAESGDDRLFGRNGNDVLGGGEGDDTLKGGNGDDILDGQEGEDRVFGENGEDELRASEGDDYLVGGADADTFIFSAGTTIDLESIGDFRNGADKLQFGRDSFGSFGPSLDDFDDLDTNGNGVLDSDDTRVTVTQSGTRLDISDEYGAIAGTHIIDVLGVTDLSASDFAFF